jgi:ribosomal protein S18 acetylase RimI-like enzyme
VAEADGKVVGFQLTQLHEPTRTGYLSDIAVHLDWRRRGIGKLLIEGALDRMRARGAEYVYGLTKLENEKIHTLLEKHDFTRGNAFYWFEKHI